MTVSELIEILQKAPANAPIACTWESICPEISGVYITAEGLVLIDSDGCFYMDRHGFRDPTVSPYYAEGQPND